MTDTYYCFLFTSPAGGRRLPPRVLARGCYDDVRRAFDSHRLAETEAVAFYREQPAPGAPVSPMKQIAARYARGLVF